MSKVRNKALTSEELLDLINKQWATVTDITKIGACGRDKAGKIKNIISEELGDNYFLPYGMVPMEKVVEYFKINTSYLKKMERK